MNHPQQHRIAVHTPPGITADPEVVEGRMAAESTAVFPLRVSAAKNAPEGLRLAAFDVTLDDIRFGEWFDMLVQVTAS